MPHRRPALVVVLLVCCGRREDAPAIGGDAGVNGLRCEACSTPALTERGRLPDPLDELSGLVASRAHPNVYWGHNDHGSKSEVFAIGPSGALRSRHVLPAGSCVDCEDVGLVACPTGTCLLLADVGDNGGDRTEVKLLRFPEPDPALGDLPIAAVDRFPFTYPDGPHDAEALIPDPAGDRAWIVLKQPSRHRSAAVFRVAPLSAPNVRLVAEAAGDLSFPLEAGAISGASVHPCASIVLLRASGTVWQLAAPAGSTLDAALAAVPTALPAAAELNGEAIAWRADGSGYVTAGEGKNAAITEASCR